LALNDTSREGGSGGKEELWWLMLQVSALGRRVAERRFFSIGTSPDQVQALRAIGYQQSITVGALARLMGLERNSASQLVERLVRQDLVERERSHLDRRQVFVRLSSEGRAMLASAEPEVWSLTGELLAGVKPSQIRDAVYVLSSMREGCLRMPGAQQSDSADEPAGAVAG
jgi:DNA-binding MarR family transcriptional regulator